MSNNGNNGFQYNYSAKERAELKKIREKYLVDTRPAELDKMEQIRKLDKGVTKKGTAIALVIGIIGALIMGFGMSIIMTDIKDILGAYREMSFMLGIVIGLVGMSGVIVAYPLYQCITKKERKRITPEILRLTDELMNGEITKI